jgi:hypothetical protein
MNKPSVENRLMRSFSPDDVSSKLEAIEYTNILNTDGDVIEKEPQRMNILRMNKNKSKMNNVKSKIKVLKIR